jgi:hypothetical protein
MKAKVLDVPVGKIVYVKRGFFKYTACQFLSDMVRYIGTVVDVNCTNIHREMYEDSDGLVYHGSWLDFNVPAVKKNKGNKVCNKEICSILGIKSSSKKSIIKEIKRLKSLEISK